MEANVLIQNERLAETTEPVKNGIPAGSGATENFEVEQPKVPSELEANSTADAATCGSSDQRFLVEQKADENSTVVALQDSTERAGETDCEELLSCLYKELPLDSTSAATTRASTISTESVPANTAVDVNGASKSKKESILTQKKRFLGYLKVLRNAAAAWAEHYESYNYHCKVIEAAEKLSDLTRYVIIFQQLMVYDENLSFFQLSAEKLLPHCSDIPQCVFRHVIEQLDLLRSLRDKSFTNLSSTNVAVKHSGDIIYTVPSSCLHSTSDKSFQHKTQSDNANHLEPATVRLVHNGIKYYGQVRGNCLDGFGIYYFSDGSVYEGTWFLNQMQGHGKLTVPEGFVFDGEFRCNRQHGKGIFTEPEGRKFIGNWFNGRLHGSVICVTQSKEIDYGVWDNGKFLYWLDSRNFYDRLNGVKPYENSNYNLLKPFEDISQCNCVAISSDSKLQLGETSLQEEVHQVQNNKTGTGRRGNKDKAFALKQKELDKWEQQAKSLPHVPHINYNRVLGRWYARVKDPNSGKRLWKGYTCSVHGFSKARELAIERLGAYSKANAIQTASIQSFQAGTVHSSVAGGSLKEEQAGFKGKVESMMDFGNGSPPSKVCENGTEVYDNGALEFHPSLNKLSNITALKSACCHNSSISDENLQCATAEELLEISRKLQRVTGVYFNPKCRAWMAYYNQPAKGSKEAGKRRFIKQFLISQSSFLEARNTAIRKRKQWEAMYGTQSRASSADASAKYSRIKLEDDGSIVAGDENRSYVSPNFTSADFLSQKVTQEPFSTSYSDQEDETVALDNDSCLVAPRETFTTSYQHGCYDVREAVPAVQPLSQAFNDQHSDRAIEQKFKVSDKTNGFEFASTKAQNDRLMHFFQSSTNNGRAHSVTTQEDHSGKPFRKRRMIPKDFVGVRHDQWGKGWRCVWSNENGMQKSRFFGESKWGKDTCKRKAEEFMNKLLAERGNKQNNATAET